MGGRSPLNCHTLLKKLCLTCPWFRSWKTTVPSMSGRTTTARAGIRARWQVLHSVTSAVLPLRHRSWKFRERSCWAHEERLLPATRPSVLMEQTSGGADASGSTSALSITCTHWAEHTSPEHLSATPDCTIYPMPLCVLQSCTSGKTMNSLTLVRLHWTVLGSAAAPGASLSLGWHATYFGFFPANDSQRALDMLKVDFTKCQTGQATSC